MICTDEYDTACVQPALVIALVNRCQCVQHEGKTAETDFSAK